MTGTLRALWPVVRAGLLFAGAFAALVGFGWAGTRLIYWLLGPDPGGWALLAVLAGYVFVAGCLTEAIDRRRRPRTLERATGVEVPDA